MTTFHNEKSLNAIKKLVEELNVGRSVQDIVASINPEEIEDLQCIEAQMAIISVVEKLGYENITKDLVLEQLKSERMGLMNTIGSKVMVGLLELTALTTDQVLAYFQAEDFKQETVQEKVAKILNLALQVNMAQVEDLMTPNHEYYM